MKQASFKLGFERFLTDTCQDMSEEPMNEIKTGRKKTGSILFLNVSFHVFNLNIAEELIGLKFYTNENQTTELAVLTLE